MGKVEIGSKEMTRKIKGKKDCERLIWEKILDKCMKKKHLKRVNWNKEHGKREDIGKDLGSKNMGEKEMGKDLKKDYGN